MLLPFAEKAFIDDHKLTGYCLSEKHITGKHKAYVFKSALGITVENYLILKDSMVTAVLLNEALFRGQNQQGDLYTVYFIMTNNDKSASVRTAWIVLYGESFPRLVSCYVKKLFELVFWQRKSRPAGLCFCEEDIHLRPDGFAMASYRKAHLCPTKKYSLAQIGRGSHLLSDQKRQYLAGFARPLSALADRLLVL